MHPRSTAYQLRDIVYLRVCDEKERGMVTGIVTRENGVTYLVSWPNREETSHFAFELSSEYIPQFGS